MRAWHHSGTDRPTSPRAILHHTDPKGPNIYGGSVCAALKNESISALFFCFLAPLTIALWMWINWNLMSEAQDS